MTSSIKQLLVILAVSVAFLFWGVGSISFLDPDEGMYGAIAKEMAETGDWITPRFNGVRYLEKPPLQFWLSALTVYLFGPSEWAVRLWSALPAFGSAILIWHLGKLLYGGRAGLLSAVVFVSSVGVFRYVRVAATDFLLVFSVTLAMYGLVRVTLSQWSIVNGQWGEGRNIDHLRLTNYRPLRRTIDQLRLTNYPVLFWLGMALGVLSKGLIGVVLPLLIVTLWAVVNSQWSIVNSQWEEGRTIDQLPLTSYWRLRGTIDHLRLTIDSPVGLLLFLGLTAPWHILAALKNPGFFEFYILDNQFLRFLNRRAFIEDDVSVGTLGFLVLTLLWFFPWSLFLPAALRQGFPRLSLVSSARERLRWLVGLWAVVVLGFFSLSSSKLEHYFLPVVPALSLMVGAFWAEVIDGRWSRLHSKRLPWSFGLGALGCSIVGIGLLLFSHTFSSDILMTGLAELNVSYRILKAQGSSFPFPSVTPFIELLKGLGLILASGVPLACFFFICGCRKPVTLQC